MSLRSTELKRCAPSEADEERASPERNMWMPGRQRNTVVCLCALVRRHVSSGVSVNALCVFTADGFQGSVPLSWMRVELALVIRFTYPTFPNGLPRGSVYYMNEIYSILLIHHLSLSL